MQEDEVGAFARPLVVAQAVARGERYVLGFVRRCGPGK